MEEENLKTGKSSPLVDNSKVKTFQDAEKLEHLARDAGATKIVRQ
ncbi:hypothetical protein [Lacticaseibacillus sp. N501-2]